MEQGHREHTRVNTNNEGWLEKIEPFDNVRGIQNQKKIMGKAKNKQGDIFTIYPYPCDGNNDGLTDSCYCWATAIKE